MNRIFKFSKGIIAFALLGLIGCSKPIDRSMVIGIYIANHKQGIDIVELKADSTYSYYFKSPEGKEFTNANRWTFEIENDKPMLTLNRFVFGLPGIGTKEPGFWVVEIEKSWSTFHLSIDSDMNFYFEKKQE